MTVHPGGFGRYLVNSINAEELVIGATYASKKFQAATMSSNKPAAVITAAVGLMIYRRRYRGIVLAGFRFA